MAPCRDALIRSVCPVQERCENTQGERGVMPFLINAIAQHDGDQPDAAHISQAHGVYESQQSFFG